MAGGVQDPPDPQDLNALPLGRRNPFHKPLWIAEIAPGRFPGAIFCVGGCQPF